MILLLSFFVSGHENTILDPRISVTGWSGRRGPEGGSGGKKGAGGTEKVVTQEGL